MFGNNAREKKTYPFDEDNNSVPFDEEHKSKGSKDSDDDDDDENMMILSSSSSQMLIKPHPTFQTLECIRAIAAATTRPNIVVNGTVPSFSKKKEKETAIAVVPAAVEESKTEQDPVPAVSESANMCSFHITPCFESDEIDTITIETAQEHHGLCWPPLSWFEKTQEETPNNNKETTTATTEEAKNATASSKSTHNRKEHVVLPPKLVNLAPGSSLPSSFSSCSFGLYQGSLPLQLKGLLGLLLIKAQSHVDGSTDKVHKLEIREMLGASSLCQPLENFALEAVAECQEDTSPSPVVSIGSDQLPYLSSSSASPSSSNKVANDQHQQEETSQRVVCLMSMSAHCKVVWESSPSSSSEAAAVVAYLGKGDFVVFPAETPPLVQTASDNPNGHEEPLLRLLFVCNIEKKETTKV